MRQRKERNIYIERNKERKRRREREVERSLILIFMGPLPTIFRGFIIFIKNIQILYFDIKQIFVLLILYFVSFYFVESSPKALRRNHQACNKNFADFKRFRVLCIL